MTLAHHIRDPQPKPSFEPCTMPSVFDAMVELYPSQKTMDQYDRTTKRLLLAGCTLVTALAGVFVAVAWGVL